VLAGQHELGIGEQEAATVAEHGGCARPRGLVAGAVAADELLRLTPVVVEAGTLGKLTHDEIPFSVARRPLPWAKEVSSCRNGSRQVGTSLPADRMRLRARPRP
jgi:hypothetical protein